MDALIHWEVPHFSSYLSYQIQAILAGTRKVSVNSSRILKNTFVAVIKDHQALIKSDRRRVLTNRWQAVGRHRERKSPQRCKLVPLLRRISQDPFDGSCIVIQANEKIFPARNDYGVIRAIIGNTVVMEPVSRRLIDELAGIVSSGSHGRTEDIGHVPDLQNPS